MKTISTGTTIKTAPAVLAALLLTACGGGGGDDDDDGDKGFPAPPASAFALVSKADALREIGNFIAVHEAFFDDEAASKAGGAAAPKALQNCTPSGTIDVASGTRNRTFEFYPAAASAVSYSSEDHHDCREDDDDGSYNVSNGYVESGLTSIESVPYYGYLAYGRNGVPFSVDERDTGAPASHTDLVDFLGTLESQYTSTQIETSYRIRLRFREKDSEVDKVGTVIHGDDDAPMVWTATAAGQTLDGVYRYATTACPGGLGAVSTLEPITFSELITDDDTDYPVGGKLQIDSGSASAVVTFNSNGTATLSINGGADQPLTLEEIAAAREAC